MRVGVYALPEDVLARVATESNFKEGHQAEIRKLCVAVSKNIDLYCSQDFRPRHFYPIVATRSYDHPSSDGGFTKADDLRYLGQSYPPNIVSGTLTEPNELTLKADLLEVTTLTTKNGAKTVAASDYLLLPNNQTPAQRLRLQPDGTTRAFEYTLNPYQANAVTGIWGYHADYGNAWESLGKLSAGVDNAVETLPITRNATDNFGFTVGFQAYDLWRIGPHAADPEPTAFEFVFVKDTGEGNNLNTIVRGVNGTAARAWGVDAPVYRWRTTPEIAQVANQLVIFEYRRIFSTQKNEGDRNIVLSTGVVLSPSGWPKEALQTLNRLKVKKPVLMAYGNEGLDRYGEI